MVAEYDPAWPQRFDQLRREYARAMAAAGVPVVAIEHVGSTAVPGLAEALQEKESYVRNQALLALRSIGSAAEDAIPALIRALRDKDATFQNQAHLTLRAIRGLDDLGTLGPGAAAAAPLPHAAPDSS